MVLMGLIDECRGLYKFIAEGVSELLFPSHCPGCHQYQPHQGQWCAACLHEIMRIESLPYSSRMREIISPIMVIAKYDKGIKQLIHELKYKKELSTIPYIQFILKEFDARWSLEDYDYVIPVPVHRDRLRKRGFNQVDKIFRKWIEDKSLVYADILERTKKTITQYELDQHERFLNVDHAFSLKEGLNIEGKSCLLVDDIFTTGSTLFNCALVLKEAGAVSIAGLVLASQCNLGYLDDVENLRTNTNYKIKGGNV